MRVETVEGFSGHSDRAQLMAYLKNLRPTPERVMTMHGDWGKTEEFARAIGMMLRKDSRALADLEAVRLK
jgi:predicted metal-dependent RNase